MPDLNLDVNYREHPKTRRLVGMLGEEAEFAPVKLWLHAAKVHPDTGKLKGYSPNEIESLADWKKEPGALISALEKLNWIKKDASENYVLVGWKDHQGHLEAFKVRGKIAAKARWSKNMPRMPKACHKHTTSNSNSDLSNAPTDGANGANGANQLTDVVASDESWRASLQLSEAYRHVNIDSEFQKAVFWCEQRKRKPTRRFFLNWINKIEAPMKTATPQNLFQKPSPKTL